MSGFEEEIAKLLQAELGAKEEEAQQIARKAAKYRRETDAEITPERMVERMEKGPHSSASARWNTLVGSLYLSGWGDDSDADPYQV